MDKVKHITCLDEELRRMNEKINKKQSLQEGARRLRVAATYFEEAIDITLALGRPGILFGRREGEQLMADGIDKYYTWKRGYIMADR